MTVDHTSEADSAAQAAPKKPRRAPTKNTTRKKATSDSLDSQALSSSATKESSSPEVEASSPVEKKKIPAKRPRKKASDQESQVKAEKDTASRIEQAAKPKRGRKAKSSELLAESPSLNEAQDVSTEQGVSIEVPVEAKVAKPRASRGRPKKAIAEKRVLEKSAEPASDVPFSDEPQSAGIEREASEVPDMPSVREDKKTRRPRRGVKAKTAPSTANEALVPVPLPESITAPISDEVEPFVDEVSIENADEEPLTPKSRRGRRGGRGKRGKKRAVSAVEALQEAMDEAFDEDESEEFVQERKASLLAKGGTSLSEGKPGRARAALPKKGAETAQRKMFISMVQGEQVEVAMVENGIIHEYYLEMLHQVKTKGNIYKGVVNNIDANLQAAFVSYGANKNGFLQIDEIHPEYYQSHQEAAKGKKFPPIQKIIKPGQEILVQVVKEPTGNKGAFLTTWLSLPGRFLVLTPGQEQIGISRKVESDEERGRLREMMSGIEPGDGLGVIVRTVSAGTSKTTLKSDLQYLKRVWKEIRKRGVNDAAPVLLYRESGLAERAIRDYLTDDVTEVWVDNTEVADSLRETVALLFPRKKELIRMHADVRQTLWERFNMHRQLEQIYAREVVLPSGGRLVFDQTEALMAIDINSGKISGRGNFESMALKTNIEAAEAIARHLKLRDIGGQVVIDFIEMRDKSHVREVEKTLRNAMKNDRARHDVARISSFGLLEIVRQRTGSSALAITMEPCPHCKGTGVRRNLEWQALQALCEMERKGRSAQNSKYVYESASAELALYLLNHKRQRITELEEQLRVSIEIRL